MTRQLFNQIKRLQKILPRFDDGRINYHGSKEALVLVIFVEFDKKFLLLKRSRHVLAYKGKWNGVGGYIDEPKTLSEKVKEELWEELKIPAREIKEIFVGKNFMAVDKTIGMKWYVYPVLVRLVRKSVIRLNREHTKYVWVKSQEFKNFDVIPILPQAFKNIQHYYKRCKRA